MPEDYSGPGGAHSAIIIKPVGRHDARVTGGLTFDNGHGPANVVCCLTDRSGGRLAFGTGTRSPGVSCAMIGTLPLAHFVRRSSNGTEVPMPVINWLVATLIVLFLCGLAIATPFLLGMAGA